MPGGDVAPLVGAAHLQLDVLVLAEPPEVVGLEQHVAELGVGDPVLALHAVPDRLLGHHLVDGHVLADVAEEVEHADRARSSRRCRPGWPGSGPGSKSSRRSSWRLDRGDVVVAACRGRAGCAPRCDRSGRRPCPVAPPASGNGPVTGQLEPAQRELPEQVADVEAVGGRVEADVDADRSRGQPGGEGVPVGGVVDEAAGLQVGEEVHSGIMVPRRPRTGRATCHRRVAAGAATASRTTWCRDEARGDERGPDDPPRPARSG